LQIRCVPALSLCFGTTLLVFLGGVPFGHASGEQKQEHDDGRVLHQFSHMMGGAMRIQALKITSPFFQPPEAQSIAT
jgi:hypothetical protein